MTADLIISYDGTPNDDDALALGKLLSQTGLSVALAYVRQPAVSQVTRTALQENLFRAILHKIANKLKHKTAECAELQKRLDAAAVVIAALHHDNQALREHLDSRTGKVADLDERRTGHSPGRGPIIGPC